MGKVWHKQRWLQTGTYVRLSRSGDLPAQATAGADTPAGLRTLE
jgi:hypothetical protein